MCSVDTAYYHFEALFENDQMSPGLMGFCLIKVLSTCIPVVLSISLQTTKKLSEEKYKNINLFL